MKLFKLTILIFLLYPLFAYSTQENETKRCNDNKEGIECGWHYGYIDPLGDLTEEKEKEELQLQVLASHSEIKEAQDCSKIEDWTEECGFVDPGTNFEFQAKQRDVFLKALVMKSGDQKSVKNLQKYNKWLVERAIEASRTGEFNLVQDPTLSSAVKKPTNAFGLQTLLGIEKNNTESVIQNIVRRNGMLVWFSRSDCLFCHKQLTILKLLSSMHELPIRNASLDEECFKEIDANCLTTPMTLGAAEQLNVNIVPSLFIYIPDDDMYIRISNGLESVQTITSRIKNFFLSIKSAQIKGISNSTDGAQNTDFKNMEDKSFTGTSEIK